MRSSLAALAAVTSLIIGATSSARAQMKVVERVGVWSASAGTTNDSGKPMCMISNNADIRSIVVKWQIGANGFYIHVGKDNWNVPVRTRAPLSLRFDQETPFAGTAVSLANYPKWIEYKIEAKDGRRFVAEFAAATRLHVSFGGGNEPDWTFRMTGSEKIMRTFTACITALNKKFDGDNATQPFSGGGRRATQPFDDGGGRRRPTQPFSHRGNDPAFEFDEKL